MIEYADTSMFTPNLVLKSTKKFLSGLFLLLFVKPPHSSTMHSIGESLVQKKCALDRCKDFRCLIVYQTRTKCFNKFFVWWSSSTMETAFRDDVMKCPWEVELLPLFRRVLGRMLAILCAKVLSSVSMHNTFFQRLWLKQVSAMGQPWKLKPWTGLQRFASKRVACFNAPPTQKVDTTMTCIGSITPPTTASSLKNQHTERKSEAKDRFALCTRKQINLDRFGGEGIWMYLGIFFLHILESQTSCRGMMWCLEEIDVHSISTGCLTSPWANEWNTIVGRWED